MFSLPWAIEKLNAQIVGTELQSEVTITGVCTDTRRLQPGNLFFALVGENADGHDYVAQALANGAVAAVVSRIPEGATGTLLVVPDTLRAFGDLAMHYRRLFAIPVVGVTGSVGKTSTKEMIAAVLRTRYNTLASEKNYNNEIGVPQTLFQLTPAHEAAVIEMGMRGLGQIDLLAEIAQPTLGVITNIGMAHIELLGSQRNIAQAKSELYARLPAGGVAILPAHDTCAPFLYDRVPKGCRTVLFSTEPMFDGQHLPHSDILVLDHRDPRLNGTSSNAPFRVRVGEAEYTVSLKAVGEHNIHNALAALAVAHALNVSIPDAIAALGAWEGAEGRMVLRHAANAVTILDDCYNASDASMRSALATLFHVGKGRRVAILGEMKELGKFSKGTHFGVGEVTVDSGVGLMITVGDMAQEIVRGAVSYCEALSSSKRTVTPPTSQHFNTSAEAAAHINELVQPGDTVLVKGSRAMGMEVIVAALMGNEDTTQKSKDVHG